MTSCLSPMGLLWYTVRVNILYVSVSVHHTHRKPCTHMHTRAEVVPLCHKMKDVLRWVQKILKVKSESASIQNNKPFYIFNETNLKGLHGSHTLGFALFLIYFQIHWCFNISTLNDQKRQSQLGLIRRLPSGSHKRHQLRCIVCVKRDSWIFVLPSEFLLLPTHT